MGINFFTQQSMTVASIIPVAFWLDINEASRHPARGESDGLIARLGNLFFNENAKSLAARIDMIGIRYVNWLIVGYKDNSGGAPQIALNSVGVEPGPGRVDCHFDLYPTLCGRGRWAKDLVG